MARKKATVEELRRLNKAREFKRKRNMLKAAGLGTDKGEDVCAICDDGGNLTCCEGCCQRSFHLDNKHNCIKTLGLTIEEAKVCPVFELPRSLSLLFTFVYISNKINRVAPCFSLIIQNIIEKEDFICKNCQYKQHQCFVCGSLGSSDATSSQLEVFQCEHDDCARFYHPKCVAQMLYPDSHHRQELFELHVAAGEGFSCPMHECIVCKEVENKTDKSMQFAVCRRCPTVYHRKCLPSDILFKPKKGPKGAMRRAWKNMLPHRILIFCMKHEIVRKLQTPARNHIIFPEANVLKTFQAAPMEQDMPDQKEAPDHSSPEQIHSSPPPAASDQNQCCCSGPFDSFAPSSLFMHPHPGSCGWLDD
ncbi:protein ENHANCED DOWNY MILDEW 2-like isoform X2 [Miscanthus floridulus]|uniref:protein ENHANCED DOWNY MILDEW 2-like isoform X2 n=1 Tax=Miscanthus floridulus TaxID=154761 RepID=UPI0034598516